MADKIETWVAQDDNGVVCIYDEVPSQKINGEWGAAGDYTEIDPSLIADTDLTPETPRRVVGLVLEPLPEEGKP